jgi:hypothetical protein
MPPTTAVTTTTDPGALPQTMDRPQASGPRFEDAVQGRWRAITTDDPSSATPFFFPLSAYVQTKAIADPTGDWTNRLLATYEGDIHRLHVQFGARAADAQLQGVDVPDAQAQWINPGAEYNKLSYWRVYGSRVRYTIDGRDASFPIPVAHFVARRVVRRPLHHAPELRAFAP